MRPTRRYHVAPCGLFGGVGADSCAARDPPFTQRDDVHRLSDDHSSSRAEVSRGQAKRSPLVAHRGERHRPGVRARARRRRAMLPREHDRDVQREKMRKLRCREHSPFLSHEVRDQAAETATGAHAADSDAAPEHSQQAIRVPVRVYTSNRRSRGPFGPTADQAGRCPPSGLHSLGVATAAGGRSFGLHSHNAGVADRGWYCSLHRNSTDTSDRGRSSAPSAATTDGGGNHASVDRAEWRQCSVACACGASQGDRTIARALGGTASVDGDRFCTRSSDGSAGGDRPSNGGFGQLSCEEGDSTVARALGGTTIVDGDGNCTRSSDGNAGGDRSSNGGFGQLTCEEGDTKL
mmetsp:Transcript_109124/g.307638  ORF Transcript_109124/g.307638 Transcript_109124/m.307638 type:complete len:349 (+) Transcript_109124:413-1459(+)